MGLPNDAVGNNEAASETSPSALSRMQTIPRANASFTIARRDVVTTSDPEELSRHGRSGARNRDQGTDPAKFLSAQGKLHAALAGTASPRAGSFTASPSARIAALPFPPAPPVVVRQHTLLQTDKNQTNHSRHTHAEKHYSRTEALRQQFERDIHDESLRKPQPVEQQSIQVRLEDLSDDVRRQRPKVTGVAIYSLVSKSPLSNDLDIIANSSFIRRTVEVPVADLVAEQRERIRELEALLESEKMRANTLLNLASRQIIGSESGSASFGSGQRPARLDSYSRMDRNDPVDRLERSEGNNRPANIDRYDRGHRSDRNLFLEQNREQNSSFMRKPENVTAMYHNESTQKPARSNTGARGLFSKRSGKSNRQQTVLTQKQQPPGDRGSSRGGRTGDHSESPTPNLKLESASSISLDVDQAAEYSALRTSPVSSTESEENYPSPLANAETFASLDSSNRTYSHLKSIQPVQVRSTSFELHSRMESRKLEESSVGDVMEDSEPLSGNNFASGSVRRISSYHGTPSGIMLGRDGPRNDPIQSGESSRYHSYCADEAASYAVTGRERAGRYQASKRQQESVDSHVKVSAHDLHSANRAANQPNQSARRPEQNVPKNGGSGRWRKFGFGRR